MGLTKEEAAKILDVKVDDEPDAMKKVPQISFKAASRQKPRRPEANEKFQRIAEAHKCLTDPNYVADETGMSEEELTAPSLEAADHPTHESGLLHRYEVMYAQFKMMCKMSGIPAPPPELMKAMMAGSVKGCHGRLRRRRPASQGADGERDEGLRRRRGGPGRDDEAGRSVIFNSTGSARVGLHAIEPIAKV